MMKAKEMTQGRRVRKRYTVQDRERLVKEYEVSGKTRREFCEARGIGLTTLHDCFRKAKRSAGGFAEVKVTLKKSAPIEVVLPNGNRLGIYLNGEQGELVKLIRGVLGC